MILIVDDHLDTCEILKRLLERRGHNVLCAGSGDDGLTIARTVLPELIILDYMMPDTSGLDVLRALKASADLRDIPVVMYSAAPGSAEREAAMGLGATA